MTTQALIAEEWRTVGTDGVRVRCDGQDVTIVVLWSYGLTETHDIRSLCTALVTDATAGRPRLVETAYVRRADDLYQACIWTCAEDDGTTVVEVDVNSHLAAAGSYPTPGVPAAPPIHLMVRDVVLSGGLRGTDVFACTAVFACDRDGTRGVRAPMLQRTLHVAKATCPNCLATAVAATCDEQFPTVVALSLHILEHGCGASAPWAKARAMAHIRRERGEF